MNLRDRTVQTVVGLTAVAVILRTVSLGSRVAHWDEGRVAYWVLEYGETGVLFYRPIVHGPLLKLVNAPLFELLGATDFAMRLFPALVGALLPLSALLFRHRLRDSAVVSLALLLALDPVLLYYSRFMRNDILVAAFSFLAFACLVRAIDFDDGRYLIVATGALALGFGAKENALAYVFAFIGAAGLLFGHRLVFGYLDGRSPVTVAVQYLRWGYDGLGRHIRSVVASVVTFLLLITYIHAPRGELPSQGLYYASCTDYDPYFDVATAPTLGEAAANPLLLPRLVWFSVGSTAELYACQWITPRTDDPNPLLEFIHEMGLIALESSTALVVLALAGFGLAVFRARPPDDLVSFTFYWGAASMVGYPFITDIGGASWLVVHIVLPLAVPAAVALGALCETGLEAARDDDTVSAALAVALVVVLVGSMAWTGYATSAVDTTDDDNPLVQYAQPSNDLRQSLDEMSRLADDNEAGPDVIVYGQELSDPTPDAELDRRPACVDWFETLPLAWYFEADDITVACAPIEGDLSSALETHDPPVVIAHEDDRLGVDNRVDDRYEDRTVMMRTTDTPFVYYTDTERLDEAEQPPSIRSPAHPRT